MSLGLSSYSSLNGLGLITGTTSGYGNYGTYGYCGGFGSKEYTEYAKEAIENGYDVSTTRQTYSTLQSNESDLFTLKCQTIQNLLVNGRTDDAIDTFENLVDTMSTLGQYSSYTEEGLKAEALNLYRNATKTELLADVSKYADSSFMSGVKNSVPVLNFFAQTNDANDFEAVITGVKPSAGNTATKIAGAVIGGGVTFGSLAGGIGLMGKMGVNSTILSSVQKALKGKTGKIAIAGAAIGLVCLGIKSLLNKATGASNKTAANV